MGRDIRIACVGLALYGVAALVTFGHAAAGFDRRVQAEYAVCMARGAPYCSHDLGAPFAGMLGAMLWPLYWSWELQS